VVGLHIEWIKNIVLPVDMEKPVKLKNTLGKHTIYKEIEDFNFLKF